MRDRKNRVDIVREDNQWRTREMNNREGIVREEL